MTRWLGPYTIEKFYDNGSMKIIANDEEGIPLLVNGFRLKTHNNPLKKEEFTTIVRGKNMDMIDTINSLNPSQ